MEFKSKATPTSISFAYSVGWVRDSPSMMTTATKKLERELAKQRAEEVASPSGELAWSSYGDSEIAAD
jgi:hypothetical protein